MADVLLVEDDDDVAFVTEFFLARTGHHVRRAADGQQGLRELSRKLPDVLLLDIEMPLMDGPEMVERMIIDNAGKERVPVVLASGKDELEWLADRLGTPYFIRKPYDPYSMLELVDRAMLERRAPTIGRVSREEGSRPSD